MEAPRTIARHEMASLEQLVDLVFMEGAAGSMFRHFPTLFNDGNRENLFVSVDGGRVVSHVGMAYRWASIHGCTLRVACIGAVSTYNEYRGQGLASELFAMARQKAFADGVDFMMISGDRTLYRRAGAADAGCDLMATIDRVTAKALHTTDVSIGDIDVDACADLYERRTAHFIRPPEDWRILTDAKSAWAQDAHLLGIHRGGVPCGYFILPQADRQGVAGVVEFAGDEAAIAGALKLVLLQRGSPSVRLRLQQSDSTLKSLFENAGATLKPETTTGTILILNFAQLMTRLTPLVERRVGVQEASEFRFAQDGERFMLSLDGDTHTLAPDEAVQALFGHPEKRFFTGALGRVFPVQPLCYGLNYI